MLQNQNYVSRYCKLPIIFFDKMTWSLINYIISVVLYSDFDNYLGENYEVPNIFNNLHNSRVAQGSHAYL